MQHFWKKYLGLPSVKVLKGQLIKYLFMIIWALQDKTRTIHSLISYMIMMIWLWYSTVQVLSPSYQWWISLIFLANFSINLMFWNTDCVWFNKEISFRNFSVLYLNSFTFLCEWFAFFQMLTISLLTTLSGSPRFSVW